MPIIQAIFENGVFRPVTPVDLPERCEVEVHVVGPQQEKGLPQQPNPSSEGMEKIYELLGKRFDSGCQDTAERHNEHQP